MFIRADDVSTPGIDVNIGLMACCRCQWPLQRKRIVIVANDPELTAIHRHGAATKGFSEAIQGAVLHGSIPLIAVITGHD
ncbi:hypothetical protein D3C75_955540 [compost metagenome]